MLTGTQQAKARRATLEYKQWKKALRAQMKSLKSQGQCFEHLAICPDSYDLFKRVKYA